MTGRKPDESPPQRKERLSAALRKNLKRRKAQARGRAALAQRSDRAQEKSTEGSTR